MQINTLIAFSIFAFVTSVTPGPNNLMLLASGVNFGFRLSLPHILGISSGFFVMVLTVGLGLAEAFILFPWLYVFLKWVGVAYLLYLAWKIATSKQLEKNSTTESANSRPMTFWSAAAFQWVNPKAWVMAVGAFSTYVPATSGVLIVAFIATLFAIINAPSVGIWALFGSTMRRFLSNEKNFRIFNYGMALLLVLSLYPILHEF